MFDLRQSIIAILFFSAPNEFQSQNSNNRPNCYVVLQLVEMHFYFNLPTIAAFKETSVCQLGSGMTRSI